MSNEYNPFTSISWQLKRIADALEEMNQMNRPKEVSSDNNEQLPKMSGSLRDMLKTKSRSCLDE